jgi:negative regulator of sigma E activity
MSRTSSSSGIVLFATSAAVLTAAFMLWQARSRPEISPATTPQPHNSADVTHADKRAMQLLGRTHEADNTLRYSAIATTTAMYGEHKMQSEARLMRAPRKLTIAYLSGDRKGLQTGYNEHWFWRRDGQQPMQAYASVAVRPDEMAGSTFLAADKNYGARVLKSQKVGGRVCQVVEVRRLQPLPGAKGPLKRLWIDDATGLTLRTDSFNHAGVLVMRSMLSKIEWSPKDKSQEFVSPEHMKEIAAKRPWMAEEMGHNHAAVATATGIVPPQPAKLPAGFVLDSVGMHRINEKNAAEKPAALSRYTDGMIVFTVFAMRTAGAKPGSTQAEENTQKSKARTGATCEFGAGTVSMRDGANGISLMAVGDLPPALLNEVLDSTRVQLSTRSSSTATQ